MKLHPAPGSALARSPDDQPGPSRAVVARPLAAATIGSLYPRDYTPFYLWLRTSGVGLTLRVASARGARRGLAEVRRVQPGPKGGPRTTRLNSFAPRAYAGTVRGRAGDGLCLRPAPRLGGLGPSAPGSGPG